MACVPATSGGFDFDVGGLLPKSSGCRPTKSWLSPNPGCLAAFGKHDAQPNSTKSTAGFDYKLGARSTTAASSNTGVRQNSGRVRADQSSFRPNMGWGDQLWAAADKQGGVASAIALGMCVGLNFELGSTRFVVFGQIQPRFQCVCCGAFPPGFLTPSCCTSRKLSDATSETQWPQSCLVSGLGIRWATLPSPA